VFNVSPAKVDNVIQGYSGGAGRLGTEALDPLLREEGPSLPAKRLSDIPLLRALIARFPGQAESIQQLYEEYGKVQEKKATYDFYRREGKMSEAVKYRTEHRKEINRANILKQYVDILGALREQQQFIMAHPTMSSEEKRQKRDRLTFQMMKWAQHAVRKKEPALP